MENRSQDDIRASVRETYAKIARKGGVASESNNRASCCSPAEFPTSTDPMASCCGPSAGSNTAESSGCVPPGVSAEQMSAVMGYTQKDIESVPEGANMGLGCGNPVALSSLKSGETVVDLGSGGGFDCFLAAKEVGQSGKIIGIDMTPDMVSKARRNAEKVDAENVEFRLGEIENLPVADNTADIIMSNCVINLSPDKLRVYKEAHRVLKPGGRLAISDVLATAELPPHIRNDLALVGACVGGAATIDKTEQLLRSAGFEDIKIKPNDHSRRLIQEWDPNKSENALDYVVSAYIEAIKPISV